MVAHGCRSKAHSSKKKRQTPSQKVCTSILALGLLLLTHSALANESPFNSSRTYINVGYTTFNEGSLGSDSLQGMSLKIGYDFTDFFAAEAVVGFSLKQSFQNESGTTDADFKISNFEALYARATLPFDRARPYLLLGFAHMSTKASGLVNGQEFSASSSESGFSYGFGIDLYGSERTAFSFQWAKLMDKDTVDVSAMTFSFTHYFELPEFRYRLR